MAAPATSQDQHPSRADAEKRVEALLSKMTLEEKIILIGGVNDFYICALRRLGLPALRMFDGPFRFHDYGETTAYPAGIAHPFRGRPFLRKNYLEIANRFSSTGLIIEVHNL